MSNIQVYREPWYGTLRYHWWNIKNNILKFSVDLLSKVGGCERCGTFKEVKPEHSRTMYHWDGTGEDPNRDRRLCREHAKEHHEYWDEMWYEYNSGRI